MLVTLGRILTASKASDCLGIADRSTPKKRIHRFEYTHNQNLFGRTGVYWIRNTINDKIYVGSAAFSFAHRWALHRKHLSKGTHHSKHLQSSWNLHGEDSFEWAVIEDCDPCQCLEREQFWIDFFKPEYNSRKNASSPLGSRHTIETRIKMSLSHGGNGTLKDKTPHPRLKGWKHTAEAREKIRLASLGRKMAPGRKLSASHRAKISSSNKGKTISRESLAKRSATRKAMGWKMPDEAKAKQLATLKATWARKKAEGWRPKCTPEFLAEIRNKSIEVRKLKNGAL